MNWRPPYQLISAIKAADDDRRQLAGDWYRSETGGDWRNILTGRRLTGDW